jgi:hypothetical protein
MQVLFLLLRFGGFYRQKLKVQPCHIAEDETSQGYSGFAPGFPNVNQHSWHESQKPQMNNTQVR